MGQCTPSTGHDYMSSRFCFTAQTDTQTDKHTVTDANDHPNYHAYWWHGNNENVFSDEGMVDSTSDVLYFFLSVVAVMQPSRVDTGSLARWRSAGCDISGRRALHASRAQDITSSPLFTLAAKLHTHITTTSATGISSIQFNISICNAHIVSHKS